MKNYTIHFLIIAIVTGLLGFTGLDFFGGKLVRIVCLLASICLMISCLDAIMVVRKKRRNNKKNKTLPPDNNVESV